HYLGDRALAAGDYQAALGHYQRALADAPADVRKQIAAVSRLAGALSGREIGERPTEAIDFGGTRLSPEEFEQVVADRLAQRRMGTGATPTALQSRPLLPARLEARPWGPEFSTRGSPLATGCDDVNLYVASQFELHGVKLNDAAANWHTITAPGGVAP